MQARTLALPNNIPVIIVWACDRDASVTDDPHIFTAFGSGCIPWTRKHLEPWKYICCGTPARPPVAPPGQGEGSRCSPPSVRSLLDSIFPAPINPPKALSGLAFWECGVCSLLLPDEKHVDLAHWQNPWSARAAEVALLRLSQFWASSLCTLTTAPLKFHRRAAEMLEAHSTATTDYLVWRCRAAGQAERNAALAKEEVERLKGQLTGLQHSQSCCARPSSSMAHMRGIDRHELKIPSCPRNSSSPQVLLSVKDAHLPLPYSASVSCNRGSRAMQPSKSSGHWQRNIRKQCGQSCEGD